VGPGVAVENRNLDDPRLELEIASVAHLTVDLLKQSLQGLRL